MVSCIHSEHLSRTVHTSAQWSKETCRPWLAVFSNLYLTGMAILFITNRKVRIWRVMKSWIATLVCQFTIVWFFSLLTDRQTHSALRVCEAFLSAGASTDWSANTPRPFIYISAEDIFRPIIPARYIKTKREAEQGIGHMMFGKSGYRSVFMRPGAWFCVFVYTVLLLTRESHWFLKVWSIMLIFDLWRHQPLLC